MKLPAQIALTLDTAQFSDNLTPVCHGKYAPKHGKHSSVKASQCDNLFSLIGHRIPLSEQQPKQLNKQFEDTTMGNCDGQIIIWLINNENNHQLQPYSSFQSCHQSQVLKLPLKTHPLWEEKQSTCGFHVSLPYSQSLVWGHNLKIITGAASLHGFSSQSRWLLLEQMEEAEPVLIPGLIPYMFEPLAAQRADLMHNMTPIMLAILLQTDTQIRPPDPRYLC